MCLSTKQEEAYYLVLWPFLNLQNVRASKADHLPHAVRRDQFKPLVHRRDLDSRKGHESHTFLLFPS